MGGHHHPQISLHTHSLGDYVRCIQSEDWASVAELMLDSANKLAAIGADFLICPDNTIHQALPRIAARLPLPWLHIGEVVAREASRRGFRTLGLTGTRTLVESEVYPEQLALQGLHYQRPDAAARAELDRIIVEELVRGVFGATAVTFMQELIGRLQAAGCDAVVLGCTEIPLIIHDGNSPLPTLDSTRLLARAAIAKALA